jgi:hypothetical protein
LGVVAAYGFSFVDRDWDGGPDVDFFDGGGSKRAGDELHDLAFEAGSIERAVKFLGGEREPGDFVRADAVDTDF